MMPLRLGDIMIILMPNIMAPDSLTMPTQIIGETHLR